MIKDDAHFRLRLPSDLKEFIRERARQNQRSITGEIVYVLRQHQKANEKGA
ncbi:Arc family DNA-binding protein [Novosphingobium sp.]|uniref:Arc family DNA-binding protein n=1 Tax=Novosphingobium sp. TaxID=1874826 RepID=UPI003D0A5C0D